MKKEAKLKILCANSKASQEEKRADLDKRMCKEGFRVNTQSPKLLHVQCLDRLPQSLREILEDKHCEIFGGISASRRKSLNWKAVCEKRMRTVIYSLSLRLGRISRLENFQRTVHVEINIPGVGSVSDYFNGFFDPYTPHSYIGGEFAIRFDLKPESMATNLVVEIRWHAEDDRKLKDPWLHFNHLKYEEGDFIYAKSLDKFDLVIGWNMIQKLELLWPKNDIAAAGEGFRQLPRTVDPDTARLNQPAAIQAREQEWERMRQHTERKAKELAATAAAAEKRN